MKHLLIRLAASIAASLALWAPHVVAAPVSGQGTWETTLHARDLTGDGVADAFYDSILDITWLRDANANLANANLVANVYVGGNMTWGAAILWADGLALGGFTDWRLPKMVDTGTPGCNFSFSGGTDCGYNVLTADGNTVFSELAHLFFQTLGNQSARDASGAPRPGVMGTDYGLLNSGNFLNFDDLLSPDVATYYWFGQELAPSSIFAWAFVPADGGQYFFSKVDLSRPRLAIAVHDGDIGTPIPEPATITTVFAGLLACWRIRRRVPVAAVATQAVLMAARG